MEVVVDDFSASVEFRRTAKASGGVGCVDMKERNAAGKDLLLVNLSLWWCGIRRKHGPTQL